MYASDLAYMIVAPITVMMMLVPFMSHWRALNTATCYMIIFTVLNCLYYFVGAVVWHDSLENYSPVYCDIATKMNIGLSVALPLASLCINRRLANLRKLTVNLHPNARRREAIIDSLICLVPTVIFMAVHYTQQGHRYNILQGFGCQPSTYLTEPGFILVILPPILISLVSCVYSVIAIRFFYLCRRDFDRYLMGSGSNMTKASYTRLMLLSASELIISVPMQIIIISLNLKVGGIAHWISWEDTKWGFSRHDSYTRHMLSANKLNIVNLELGRWFSGPFLCVLFFIFFGFSQDVFRSWYQVTRAVSTKVFRHPMPSWDEYLAQRDARTSSGTSRQASITLFGRVVSLPWKKSVSTGTTKSVSVVLPSHSSSDRSSSHRKHRDSLGFSLATDADADEALDLEKGDLGSCGSSTKNSPISFNEKDMKDMPELDMAALDAVLPSITPSAAHSQISIQVDVERAERRD